MLPGFSPNQNLGGAVAPGVELSRFVHANRARVFDSKPYTPLRNWTRDRIVTKTCCSNAGVPNLEYMYPQGYICLSEGVHLRLAIEEKSIFKKISVNIIFKNHYMLVVKYIYE